MKACVLGVGLLALLSGASAGKVGIFDVNRYNDDLGDPVSMVRVPNSDKSEESTIVFACSTDGFEIYYDSGGYPFSANLDSIKTRYKFGTFPSSASSEWNMATSHDALFVPSSMRSAFLKQAKSSSKLTMTMLVGPSYGISNTQSFNFTGFAKVAATYLKCAK